MQDDSVCISTDSCDQIKTIYNCFYYCVLNKPVTWITNFILSWLLRSSANSVKMKHTLKDMHDINGKKDYYLNRVKFSCLTAINLFAKLLGREWLGNFFSNFFNHIYTLNILYKFFAEDWYNKCFVSMLHCMKNKRLQKLSPSRILFIS